MMIIRKTMAHFRQHRHSKPASFTRPSRRSSLLSALGVAGLAGLMLLTGAPAALAQSEQPRSDQGAARRELREGNVLKLREIEQRILPMMPGKQYLGPEYDPSAMVYRLKFIENGRVSFVDVDARTGRILRQK